MNQKVCKYSVALFTSGASFTVGTSGFIYAIGNHFEFNVLPE